MTTTLAGDAFADRRHLLREAEAFGRYILGQAPAERAKSLYVSAVECLLGPGDSASDPILRFSLDHAWSLPLLDSALAIRQPDAPLRGRLLIMLAVLEVQPQYCERFLPASHTAVEVCRTLALGALSVPKAILGLLLLHVLLQS